MRVGGGPDVRTTIVSFTLPASTYATMCLRELTKQSTELGHQLALGVAADTAAAAAAAAPAPTTTAAADTAAAAAAAAAAATSAADSSSAAAAD